MTLSQLTHRLQALCHEGHSHNEVFFQVDGKAYDITTIYNADSTTVLAGLDTLADEELADVMERERE